MGFVELSYQVFDARDVSAAVADDQRVGRANGRKMPVLRHQGTDQWNQFSGGGMLDLDDTGLQQISTGRSSASLRLGFSIGHDSSYFTLGEHAEAVGGHD